MEAMECVARDDIKRTNISVGQQKLIMKAVSKLCKSEEDLTSRAPNDLTSRAPNEGETPSVEQVSEVQPQLSGNEAFAAKLLQNAHHARGREDSAPTPIVGVNAQMSVPLAPVTGNASWQDPQFYLKSLASTKSNCYNIMDFVDVGVSNFSEKVLSSGEEFELVCRAGARLA